MNRYFNRFGVCLCGGQNRVARPRDPILGSAAPLPPRWQLTDLSLSLSLSVGKVWSGLFLSPPVTANPPPRAEPFSVVGQSRKEMTKHSEGKYKLGHKNLILRVVFTSWGLGRITATFFEICFQIPFSCNAQNSFSSRGFHALCGRFARVHALFFWFVAMNCHCRFRIWFACLSRVYLGVVPCFALDIQSQFLTQERKI